MKNKVGIYPGSFNPFHKGHLDLVRTLLREKICDEIIIVPTPNYWDKQNLPSQEDRGRFIQTVLFETGSNIDRRIHVWTPKAERTLEMLGEIARMNPEDDRDTYSLIIGADNVKDFNKWKDYEKIIDNYEIVIVGRGVKPDMSLFKNYKYIDFNNPISSTEVRERLAKGETEIYGINYKWN